jgi:hypothetical protein
MSNQRLRNRKTIIKKGGDERNHAMFCVEVEVKEVKNRNF